MRERTWTERPWRDRPRRRGRARRMVVASLLGWALAGCSLDGLLNSNQVPPDVTDPAITKTHDGALTAYRGVLLLFLNGFGATNGVVHSGALLSDELHLPGYGSSAVDQRYLPESVSDEIGSLYTFGRLQKVRGQAEQAIGLLNAYAPEQQALVGHSYALKGYAEIMLAELYCSGIPLSTLDFDGNYTLQPGSTTAEVFQHAAAAFDTALTLVGDSARFVHLAAIGKARALLGLGNYGAAAAAAAAVPDTYQYEMHYVPDGTLVSSPASSDLRLLPYNFLGDGAGGALGYETVADQEGGNGLDYVGSGDPRIAVTIEASPGGDLIYFPSKYAANGSPIVLASGVEARLIEAEAALSTAPGDGVWLAKLNALRTDGTFDTQPNASDPSRTDTLWHAGTGGVDSLRPLEDPSSADARVDLLFRERAFWLFLTGHRQGDLRRLIRQYRRLQNQVYPIGPYLSTTPGLQYRGDITLPIPISERIANPQFTGCISRTP